jgi:hypothetical protein
MAQAIADAVRTRRNHGLKSKKRSPVHNPLRTNYRQIAMDLCEWGIASSVDDVLGMCYRDFLRWHVELESRVQMRLEERKKANKRFKGKR